MQQIYLLEIFVDNVRVFVTGEEERSSESKNLTVKIGFGPKTEIFIKEHQLDIEPSGDNDAKENKEVHKTEDEDLVTVDEYGRRGWTRKVRVGKSFLFPSYSDTVLTTLRDFPLEIEVWNDDEREIFVFAASGVMRWDKQFFEWLQVEDQPDELHESFCVKQVVPLKSDCCCKILGEIELILRLNAFGDSITTEFQATNDEDLFYIRSNKSPNVLHCNRLEPFDNLNFVTIGPIYDTVNLEDPSTLGQEEVKVCTEFDLQPCSKGAKPDDVICRQQKVDKNAGKIENNTIRMGDIKGPCGNPNCKLAHKVRTFLRKLDSYKGAAAAANVGDANKDPDSQNICGSCICKQEKWHRESCPEKCVKREKCNENNEVKFNSKLITQENSTPSQGAKDEGAHKNVETRICLSESCRDPNCPGFICKNKTTNAIQNETHVNPSLFVPKPEHKTYYTYRDLQRLTPAKNKTDEADDEKSSPYSQNFIVQNVTVKYDVYPRKPCSRCGCRCQMQNQNENDPQKYEIPNVSRPSDVTINSSEDANYTKIPPQYDPAEMLELVKEIRDRDTKLTTRNEKSSNHRKDESRDQTRGVTKGETWGGQRSEPKRENIMVWETRDRPSPFSQFVYKALSDHKPTSAAENETIKQQACDSKDDKECKCDPPKPTPPCKTFDCQCLEKNIEIASRKLHKPYCPNYIHKENCPVNKTDADEENEDEEDEPEPLPYGLPPIQLGPCPVLGRPCSVPDGFARMYKVAAIPPQPPSWSNAGKICCSKEFERIKKAIEEYMKYEKSHDMRCLNKFNIDTERRCCDKEQRLIALIGKGCCGSHKMALQEKYKEYKEKNNQP